MQHGTLPDIAPKYRNVVCNINIKKRPEALCLRAGNGSLLLWLFWRTCFGSDMAFLIRNPDNNIGNIAFECLTNQIQMLQVDPVGQFPIIIVYGAGPYLGHPSQIGLCVPSFAKSGT